MSAKSVRVRGDESEPMRAGILEQVMTELAIEQECVVSESLPRRSTLLTVTSVGVLREKVRAVIAGCPSLFFRAVKEKEPIFFCVPGVKVPFSSPLREIVVRMAFAVSCA